MNEEEIKQYEELKHFYQKTMEVRFGRPDEFQYHQNNLCQKLAEFLLNPYMKWMKTQSKNWEK